MWELLNWRDILYVNHATDILSSKDATMLCLKRIMRYLKNLDKGKGSIELCHSVSWCDNHTTASFEESDMWRQLLVINCT